MLLHLLKAGYFLHKAEESSSQDVADGENTLPIRTIYFETPNAFPEINSFTYETAATYARSANLSSLPLTHIHIRIPSNASSTLSPFELVLLL